MKPDDYETILRSEFGATEGSFLSRLRSNLVWDKAAFSHLIAAMEACAMAQEGESYLPRWIAEGFWYCSDFARDWSSHPDFPHEHDPDYYQAAYTRLHDLAYWLFTGERLYGEPLEPL